MIWYNLASVEIFHLAFRRRSRNKQASDNKNELLPDGQTSTIYNTVFEIYDNQIPDEESNDYLKNSSQPDGNVNTTDLDKKYENLYGNQESKMTKCFGL